MNRSEFFDLAADRGWVRGTPLTQGQRNALRTAIKNRVDQSDARGRIVNEGGSRPMDSDEAADALMEELR